MVREPLSAVILIMHRHDPPDVGLHGVWLRDQDAGCVPDHPNGSPGVENQHLRLILDVQPDRRAIVWGGLTSVFSEE